MKKQNKMIYRSFIIISFIAINALILFGISQTLSFLGTGADRSMMLRVGLKNKQAYVPKITWKDTVNPGRPIEKQTMKDIQKDYVNSWYVRNVGYATYDSLGVFDFYTKSSREHLIKNLKYNQQNDIKILSTTLGHQLFLDFYSADGQLVVFEDKNVKAYHQVFKDNELKNESVDISNYKVAMLLEDGFWRIRHLVKEEADPSTETIQQNTYIKIEGKSILVDNQVYQLKGINYYPQKSPWDTFGNNFDESVIKKDFKLLANAGLNTIRIFVGYEDFGKEFVNQDKLQKLKYLLDLTEESGLKVIVTLFDFYGNYAIEDWTFTHRHMEQIVTPLKDHKAILAWDIKNEPNLDFESRNQVTVLAWLKEMIWQVKQIDKNHPVTIGWSSIKAAKYLEEEVDLVSFHYYEDLNKFTESFAKIRSINKPLVLQEFGVSSYRGLWVPFGLSKEKQANYHKDFQTIIQNEKLHYLSWTLYDFEDIPSNVVGNRPWRKNKQKHFGFIDNEGNKKPSFKYISH